jgi:DMSO reductase iron-sulfur subunit
MQKGFLFDLNKCTGCNACQIACSIENEVPLPYNWRQVITYNESRYPEIPVFNLSMACNHCIEPPCLKYCPALAISKDENNGAVLIDEAHCIGCKYCSWVCPYDAPVFNNATGTMEKCTFCIHRLEEDLNPACVTLCPTNALQFSDHTQDLNEKNIPGFTHTEIKPAIQFIPLRKNQEIPAITEVPFDEMIIAQFRASIEIVEKKEKIRCLPELPLVIFSLLIAFITGSLVGQLLRAVNSPRLLPIILGFVGLVISTFHLGKKIKAPRAILNLKNSWLSREIVFFGLLLTLLCTQILFFPEVKWLGWLAVFAGFTTLYALDKVYSVLALITKINYQSANTFLTGLFFAALFSHFLFGIVIFGGIKLILYLKQLSSRSRELNTFKIISASTRLGFGFLVPLLFWIFQIPGSWTIVISLILIGELIDRCEFYENLKIITPEKQMAADLKRELTTKDTKKN